MNGWEVVIGLETHCQLGTRAKLFCACPNEFGAPPNRNVCAVCTGQPGTLPVLNAEALALAVRAGLALGCTLAPVSRFDRKNYFYCDLPKGFQTTQYAVPVATGGGITLACDKHVRLTRIHIEEDAGKAIHDRGAHTLVDLNRAGVPLIEIVTEPDLSSAEEAHEYLVALKEILVYAGVSDCDMEKGSLRCDVNVSVRRPGEALRTKVELKNLNSFKNAVLAIEHEIERQVAAYEAGEPVAQETRLFDVASGTTRTMRTKEDEDDYRYFPEPDLPPAIADEELVTRERAALPELPAPRRARYTSELGLSEYDAGVLTGEREVADFFEAAVALGGAARAKALANWLANDVLAALGGGEVDATGLDGLALRPERLVELVALVEDGTLGSTAAREVLRALMTRDVDARALVRELGLEQVSDADAIDDWCRAALEANPTAAAEVRAGNAKALGALIGPAMKASGGRADPALVRARLLELIQAAGGG